MAVDVQQPAVADPGACTGSRTGPGTCTRPRAGPRTGSCARPGPAPAPAPAPSPTGLNLTSYGAVCDGRTDNSAAISRGIADAKSKNLPLVVPAGQCNFSAVIRLDSAKITGYGATSILYATNYQAASIFMSGAAPSVTNVKLTGAAAPSRQAAWESTKITVFGATDFVIDGVTIEGAPAASIQTAQAPTRGRISNNVIRNSLSDSIHMTGGASYITVEGNLVEYSGDDGIAVVSYTSEGSTRVHDITARNNTVRNNKFGRNMSVVGGNTITYENNLLQGNLSGYACFLVAQENVGTLATQGSNNVRFANNTIQNCGSNTTGHGGVLVYSDGAQTINNVVLLSNLIEQQGQTGIRAYGNYTTGLQITNNQITGANPALNITTPNYTYSAYTGGTVGYVAP